MEVPEPVLLNLKCENCECYLSRGPILMLDDERIRCGRCPKPEHGAKRMKPYEELAKLMAFPCRYKENGCEEKIRFQESKLHEEHCAYRMHVCAIIQSGKCDWSGVRGDLLDHCKHKHPDNVIENPVQFKHDITKSSISNYLLFAFQMLFLVQTRVCIVTRKIYHCVRLFGNPKFATKYMYDIDIANINGTFTRQGDVVPMGCLELQADTSVALNIDGLQAMLGEFPDPVFRLTVRSTDDEAEKKMMTVEETKLKNDESITTENSKIQVTCWKCKSLTDPVYKIWQGWMCNACASKKRACAHNAEGCKHYDSDRKCYKHEQFYCPYSTYCNICSMPITSVGLDMHYIQDHSDIIYRSGTVCYERKLYTTFTNFIIKSHVGYLVCMHHYSNLLIRSPIPTEQLYKYKCVVEVNNLQTCCRYITKTATYDLVHDWLFDIRNAFESAENNYTLTIDIIKNENPLDLEEECIV